MRKNEQVSFKFIILCLVLVFCFGKNSFAKKTKNSFEDSVWNYIQKTDIKFKKVVFAQAILESGNFNSKVFKKTNNIFGMRFPKKRLTNAIGKFKGYSKYCCWQDAIDDFSYFQRNLKSVKTQKDYFKFLDKIYCSFGYSKELKRVLKNV